MLFRSGSGFGGKGLERLDTERDAQSRAERAAYGEAAGPAKPVVDEATGEAPPVIDVADLEIEIHKGPAPDTSKGRGMGVSSLVTAKAAEQAALLAGCVLSGFVGGWRLMVCDACRKPAGIAKAQGVIANINAMLKAKMAGGRPGETDTSTDAARRRDPDATDYHARLLLSLLLVSRLTRLAQAIVYINDYPQKARWKVTNKDTMVQVRRPGSSTGTWVADTVRSLSRRLVHRSLTKERSTSQARNRRRESCPSFTFLSSRTTSLGCVVLDLLLVQGVSADDSSQVKHAISEIKRSLIEGATMALEVRRAFSPLSTFR